MYRYVHDVSMDVCMYVHMYVYTYYLARRKRNKRLKQVTRVYACIGMYMTCVCIYVHMDVYMYHLPLSKRK